MDDIGPCGLSQSPLQTLPGQPGSGTVALSGDVDADGEVVDALTQRLRRAICDASTIDCDLHLAWVRDDVRRCQGVVA